MWRGISSSCGNPEAHLVFDLDVALDQSEKNPVYKVQYAHARMCSIFRKAGVVEEEIRRARSGSRASCPTPWNETSSSGWRISRRRSIERPASRAPHVLCDFLEQTAGAVNSWYHAGNPTRNPELAVLVEDAAICGGPAWSWPGASGSCCRNGLSVLGVSAPTRMERPEEKEDE